MRWKTAGCRKSAAVRPTSLLFFQARGKAADDLTGEEKAAIAAHIDELVAAGWNQRPDGSWHKPDPESKATARMAALRIRTFD